MRSAWNRRTHSAAVRARKASRTSGSSASRFRPRSAKVAKRGSCDRSGISRTRHIWTNSGSRSSATITQAPSPAW